MMMTTDNKPYIRVENLKKYFSTKRGMLHAVEKLLHVGLRIQ